MAEEIQEKLFTMRSIGAVNRLMNHDLARRTMLKYILHLLSIRYRATFGLIGFLKVACPQILRNTLIGKILNLMKS